LSAVRRHPIFTFFVLTYALTWGFLPLGIFGATGPLIAALIVIPITQGRAGLRELGSRMIRWRVRWYWYVLAIGLPLAVFLVDVTLNVALGAPAPSLAQLTPFSGVIVVFAVRLINPLDGPMGEEPGWRGFAQPRLQASRSPLLATLILAVLVAVWHVPLVLLPQFGGSPLELLATFAVTFWYAWLFNHTGGSVLLTLVAHSTQGIVQTNAFWAAEAAATRVVLLDTVVWCVVAIGLVIFDWRFWRGPGPAPATVQPAYEGESRVR
jgi:uncharacterized protein